VVYIKCTCSFQNISIIVDDEYNVKYIGNKIVIQFLMLIIRYTISDLVIMIRIKKVSEIQFGKLMKMMMT
jgi:hypothetical protein